MGAISRSCSTAKACNSGSSPGPTRVINGLASSTSSSVTTSSPRPTKVLMAAKSCALSFRSRLAMTLTMALWNGPLMPPSRISKNPGST